MLLALPSDCPLCKEWQWSAGDIVYFKNWDMLFLIDFASPNGVSAVKLNSLTPTFEINPDVPINDAIRPIPSQRQLQDIAKKTIEEKYKQDFIDHGLPEKWDDWRLLIDFYNVIHDSFYRVFHPGEYTFEMMWLQYLMWISDKRRWNGEKWV